MNNSIHKKINIFILVAAILGVTLFITIAADGVTPGSDQDPIVTQSYVEQKSDQIKYYIDTLTAKINDALTKQTTDIAAAANDISSLKTALAQKDQEITKLNADVAKLQQSNGTAGTKFEVVLVNKGKTMLTGEGTEIIARSGKSTAIKGAGGGLTDVTSGKDLTTGAAVLANHMIISARNDGRGIKAALDSYYLVKGQYTIK